MSTGVSTSRRPATRQAARPGRPAQPPRGWRHDARQRVRRMRSRRRPGLVLLAWLAMVAVFAGAVIFLFFYSAAFVVKDIEVSGGREQVQQSARELARIPHGRPLARVAEGPVSERVLADTRIAEVTVERRWPSGVRLVLTEREPVLALTQEDTTWLADADGTVYEQVEQASNRLPRFETRGDPTELDQATVAGVAQLWRMRPDPDVLKGDLSRPRVAADGSVSMRVANANLVWGPPVDNEKKWQVVQAILGQESVDPAVEPRMRIDVRVPDTPVVTGLPPAP